MTTDRPPGQGPVPLALAVTAAGAVAQIVGLAARAGAVPGSARHDGGGALMVAGLVVVVAGLAWQLTPWVTRLAVDGRRAFGLLVGSVVAAVLVLGVAIGVNLGGDATPSSGGPAGAPAATSTPAAPAGSATPAGAGATAGSTGAAGQSLGAVIAGQGLGWNTPPPSIDTGVTFPAGDSRAESAGETSPWGTAPLTPATVPPQPATTGGSGTPAPTTAPTTAPKATDR